MRINQQNNMIPKNSKVCRRKLLRLGESLRLIFNKLKKRREELWLNLPLDVLGIIFNKLKMEKQGSLFAQVCRCWRAIAIAYDESSWLLRSFGPKSILLMQYHAKVHILNKLGYYIFSDDDEDENNNIIEKSLGFYELISSCRGGWIFLLSSKTGTGSKDDNLKLWNPIFDVKISLPYFSSSGVAKAITFFGDNFGIGVALISIDGRLAFVKCGDFKWTYLFCEGEGERGFDYEDLISSKDSILALSKNEGESSIQIQAWNFEGSNILDLKLDFPQDIEPHYFKKYTHKLYIAESRGTVFLVVRLIDKTVKLGSETLNFYVYVLDDENKGWSRVESLGDLALFVGKNQTMLLHNKDFKQCQKNSIYFTDYYPRRGGEFHGYVGSVYYLEDSSIQKCRQQFYNTDPSFWIISGV